MNYIKLISIFSLLLINISVWAENVKTAADYSNMGMNFYNKNQNEDAKKAFNSALKLDPNDRDAIYGIYLLWHSESFFKDQKESEKYYLMGHILLDMDKYTLASQSFDDALTLDPNLTLAQKGLENIKLAQKARAWANKSIEMIDAKVAPDEISLYVKRALQIYPVDPVALYAEYILKNMAEFDPKKITPDVKLALLGDIFLEKGYWTRAITYYSQAIDLNPVAKWYIKKGDVLRAKGFENQAKDLYKKALSQDPNNFDAIQKSN